MKTHVEHTQSAGVIEGKSLRPVGSRRGGGGSNFSGPNAAATRKSDEKVTAAAVATGEVGTALRPGETRARARRTKAR